MVVKVNNKGRQPKHNKKKKLKAPTKLESMASNKPVETSSSKTYVLVKQFRLRILANKMSIKGAEVVKSNVQNGRHGDY